MDICKAESLDIDEGVIEEVIILCRGDMRKIVNMLQSLKLSVSSGIKDNELLDRNRFFEIMGIVPLETVKEIFNILISDNYTQARESNVKRMQRSIH